jgi:hypothetical protein
MNQNCNLAKEKHGKQTIVSLVKIKLVSWKHQNATLSFLVHSPDDMSNSLFLHIFINLYILVHILFADVLFFGLYWSKQECYIVYLIKW